MLIRIIKNPIFILFAIFAFNACKKSKLTDNAPTNGTGVYVTANVRDSTTGDVGIAYWKNGQLVNFLKNVQLGGGAVHGTDVYQLGSDVGNKPAYFKNWGSPVDLDLGGYTSGGGSCIAFLGNDMYIGGSVSNDNFTTAKSAYWKNGVLNILPGGKGVTGIAVNGTDVYFCGFYATVPPLGVYWKNGGQPIFDNTNTANCIAVNGTDVYLGGSSSSAQAVFSKNGVATVVSNAGQVDYIATNGTDVFMAGQQYTMVNKAITLSYASYWKNKTATVLFNNAKYSYTGGIFLNGSDVYVAGQSVDINTGQSLGAYYWKNGTQVQLERGKYQIIVITGIVYVP